jgi:hypothetical protein
VSYVCQVCNTPCPAGQSRILHVEYVKVPRMTANGLVYGTRIHREVPVCKRCKRCLEDGLTMPEVRKQFWTDKRAPDRPKHVKPDLGVVQDIKGEVAAVEPDKPVRPVCDLCGEDATDGQVTEHGIICMDCIRRVNAGSKHHGRRESRKPARSKPGKPQAKPTKPSANTGGKVNKARPRPNGKPKGRQGK